MQFLIFSLSKISSVILISFKHNISGYLLLMYFYKSPFFKIARNPFTLKLEIINFSFSQIPDD